MNKTPNLFSLIKLNKMKRQSKFFTAFNLKTLFILICINVGFAGFSSCQAQAIVGKWRGVSAKYFCRTAAGAKMVKQDEESQSKEMGKHGYEFKSDHGVILMHFSSLNSTEVTTMENCTWSLSGDQLTTILDAHQSDPKYNPKKGDAPGIVTIQISGNTLLMTMVMPKSNPTVNRIEYAYKKM